MPNQITIVERSKSATATCDQRNCLQKIAKGTLRFGIPTNIMGNHTTKWRHVQCCTGYQAATYLQNEGGGRRMQYKPDPHLPKENALEDLTGWSALTDPEKSRVRAHLRHYAGTATPAKPRTTDKGKKRKADDDPPEEQPMHLEPLIVD